MANVLVNEASLSGIASALRERLGVQTTWKPAQMAAAIESIPTGGAAIHSGADEPAASLGSDGDLYLRYDMPFLLPAEAPFAFLYVASGDSYYAAQPESGQQVFVFVTGVKDVYFVSATNVKFKMSRAETGSNAWSTPNGSYSQDGTTGLYFWLRNDMTANTINPSIPRCASFADGMSYVAAMVSGSSGHVVTRVYCKVDGAWTTAFEVEDAGQSA